MKLSELLDHLNEIKRIHGDQVTASVRILVSFNHNGEPYESIGADGVVESVECLGGELTLEGGEITVDVDTETTVTHTETTIKIEQS